MIYFKNITLIISVAIIGFILGFMFCSRKIAKEITFTKDMYQTLARSKQEIHERDVKMLSGHIKSLEDSLKQKNIVFLTEITKPSGEKIKKVKIDKTSYRTVKKEVKKEVKVADNKQVTREQQIAVAEHANIAEKITYPYKPFFSAGLMMNKEFMLNQKLESLRALVALNVAGPVWFLAEASPTAQFYNNFQFGFSLQY